MNFIAADKISCEFVSLLQGYANDGDCNEAVGSPCTEDNDLHKILVVLYMYEKLHNQVNKIESQHCQSEKRFQEVYGSFPKYQNISLNIVRANTNKLVD